MSERRKEPEHRWLVDVIVQEQVDRMCGRDPHPHFDRAEPVTKSE